MSIRIAIEYDRPQFPYTAPCPEHGPDCPHKVPGGADFRLSTEYAEADAVYLRVEGIEIRIPVEVWRKITTAAVLARVEDELASAAELFKQETR